MITIISSYSKDILPSGKKLPGGPAKFIKRVLDLYGAEYKLISGEEVTVEINENEKGKINYTKDIHYDEPVQVLFLSTILNEFNIKALGNINCLDIQGYVRDGSKFGGKKRFESQELSKFDIIKGTENEFKYLNYFPHKSQILLITRDEKGFDVKFNGEIINYNVEPINCPNTIGAGDTLFAAFCMKYLETKNINECAYFAIQEVKKFLRSK